MEIFWRLVLGHIISDFTLQTNYIAAWKRRSFWGLFVHCIIHPIMYTLFLWKYLDQVWLQIGPLALSGGACVLIVFIGHFIEDQWRVWSVEKKGAPDNTFFYLWDQVIHYAVIFAVAPVVDGHAGKFGFLYYPPISGILDASQAAGLGVWDRFSTIVRPEPWVFLALLFAIITHFTTVTIYFLEKDMYGAEFPNDTAKYGGMAERLVVMACFLLPGYWWLAVVVVWIARSVVYKWRNVFSTSWISISMGNGMSIICGVVARCLLR